MRVRALSGVPIFAFALGCRLTTEAPAIETRVIVERTSLRLGDTLIARTVSKNRGTRDAVFLAACKGPVARLFDTAGRRADEYFCAIPESTPIRLAPGDSLVSEQRFRMERPGSFAVVGGFQEYGLDSSKLLAPSAPVFIEVSGP
jgi:hypothetical protein